MFGSPMVANATTSAPAANASITAVAAASQAASRRCLAFRSSNANVTRRIRP